MTILVTFIVHGDIRASVLRKDRRCITASSRAGARTDPALAEHSRLNEHDGALIACVHHDANVPRDSLRAASQPSTTVLLRSGREPCALCHSAGRYKTKRTDSHRHLIHDDFLTTRHKRCRPRRLMLATVHVQSTYVLPHVASSTLSACMS